MDKPDMSAAAVWVTAGSTLLGVLVGLFGQFLLSVVTTKRERESRRDARREAALQRQNEFQRETLLALQDSLTDANESVLRIVGFGKTSQIVTGHWSDEIPDDMTKDLNHAVQRVQKFCARIADGEVRLVGTEMARAMQNMFIADGERETLRHTVLFHKHRQHLIELSGDRLRALEHELLK